MTNELAGQTVVLIGGSAGIGLETARRTRSEGADVILLGRDTERLRQAAAEVDTQHRRRRRHRPSCTQRLLRRRGKAAQTGT